MSNDRITVAGAGILGLWQALTLARRGFRVKLLDRHVDPAQHAVSRQAGAMLAPWVEAESAPALVQQFGEEGLALWRATYPGVVRAGTLVVAAPRDQPDLVRFARMTANHLTLDRTALGTLEPSLAGRFPSALYYPDEAHFAAPNALADLLKAAVDSGVDLHLGQALEASDREGLVIDCRGLAARHRLPDLRGVRGERLLIRCADVSLGRPVRLLHPRHPLYVVPWSGNRFLVGATMIESEDDGPATVRSALELLGAAYALHPAFGEAEILEMTAGVRPAFPDNVPRARIADGGRTIMVNGAYRHGYLLAPILAKAVADYLSDATPHPLLQAEARGI